MCAILSVSVLVDPFGPVHSPLIGQTGDHHKLLCVNKRTKEYVRPLLVRSDSDVLTGEARMMNGRLLAMGLFRKSRDATAAFDLFDLAVSLDKDELTGYTV